MSTVCLNGNVTSEAIRYPRRRGLRNRLRKVVGDLLMPPYRTPFVFRLKLGLGNMQQMNQYIPACAGNDRMPGFRRDKTVNVLFNATLS